MTPHFDPRHYYLLKNCVLQESKIKDIVPSDCKFLSSAIFHKIKKRISETTLKRVYGFAFAEFKPSLFTINTLAEYCGFENWHAFQKDVAVAQNMVVVEHKNWHQTLERANEITRTTLQVLKNKSGVPYERTIPRDFINDHFDAFFKEEATVTVLLAPSGYGKTIALCHWLDNFIKENNYPHQRDVILFFSGSALINAYESGHNLNNWLLALLGLDPDNFLNDLFLPGSGFDGWFYLVIDGLDEVHYKGNHFANVFEQLNDIIALHNNTHRLKILITMRSATWCNNEHNAMAKDHWFKGFMVENSNCINVPLMDNREIMTLVRKLEPQAKQQVSDRAVKTLGLPVLFQYYVKKANALHHIADFDEAEEFDVISAYVLNKIYKSRYSIEMITFIREFLEHQDYKSKDDGVGKLKVQHLIKNYHQAYEELINIGYIENVDASHDTQLNNYIRFCSPMWKNHSIAEKFYYDNGEVFDQLLLDIINLEIVEECQRVNVLKWCIYKTISSGKTIDFNILSGFETTLSRKSDLISFVSKLLQRFAEWNKPTFDNKFDGKVSEYFVGLEYANVNYEQALRTILNFKLTNTEEILLKCSLCVIAILELDINKMEKLIEDLRAYPAETFEEFAIHPLVCLDTVFYYLKYGIVKHEAFAELTKFYFNPPAIAYSTEKNSFNEVLFMLGIHTLTICKSPTKTLRFINTLKRIYPRGSVAYKFLIDVSTAEALLATNQTEQAFKIYTPLLEKFDEGQHGFTPVMKVYFKALKVKIISLEDDRPALLAHLNKLIKLCEEYSYKLVKVGSLAFILSEFAHVRNNPDDTFDNFYFDMIRTARSTGCRTESFYEAKTYNG